jgi:uncharacterized membrane-anchored protein
MSDLGERINRAASLARVRVEMRREEGNQELLRALAQRQKQQLQLQQAVEGLSVVAISYYALGLIGYLTRGVKALSLASGLRAETVVGLAAVPVVACVALFVRRLRRHWA